MIWHTHTNIHAGNAYENTSLKACTTKKAEISRKCRAFGIHGSLWPGHYGYLKSSSLLNPHKHHTPFLPTPKYPLRSKTALTSWARQVSQGISTFLFLFPPFTVTIPGFIKKKKKKRTGQTYTIAVQFPCSKNAPLRGTGVVHALWEPQEMCGRAREWPFPRLATKQPQCGLKISKACFSCCKTGGSKITKKTSTQRPSLFLMDL